MQTKVRHIRIWLAAMIIGMAPVLPASAQQNPAFPSPVAFTNNMELGDIGQATAWLEAGLPPDFLGSRIGSGLMIGAWEGNFELMRVFLEHGANIDALNGNGETALALAAFRGNFEAVKWLVERGAKINAAERQWSPLHYAVFSGKQEIVDFLLERGADINARSSNGSSVLMMAIYEGKPQLARKLLEKGADPSPRNDWGDGAMEWAMRHNQLEVARMLTSPEEFNIAVNQPKETWGEPVRSLPTSRELDELLAMRARLVERGQPTAAIDKRIAAERVRIVRAELDRKAPAPRAAALEIKASRKQPGEQSANVVYDADGKAAGYKVPPATYFGKPKMPPKGKVKNY